MFPFVPECKEKKEARTGPLPGAPLVSYRRGRVLPVAARLTHTETCRLLRWHGAACPIPKQVLDPQSGGAPETAGQGRQAVFSCFPPSEPYPQRVLNRRSG